VMLFFIGFSMHEPIMQSLAAKYAKAHQKGAALGVFTTFGYLGTFIGGVLGGYLYQVFGPIAIAIFVGISSFFWIILIAKMPNPALQKNLYLSLDEHDRSKVAGLASEEGVLDWYINETEALAIVRFDSIKTSYEKLKESLHVG